jgi:hypothetical protein
LGGTVLAGERALGAWTLGAPTGAASSANTPAAQ